LACQFFEYGRVKRVKSQDQCLHEVEFSSRLIFIILSKAPSQASNALADLSGKEQQAPRDYGKQTGKCLK
jgi:hypothetical protein